MTTLILALVAGAVVGLALGGLGGGGSVLAVPALIYLLGFTTAEATTASLVIVTLTSVTALVGHARDGNVVWRTGLLFAAAGIVPAMLAGAAAGHLPQAVLTAAFSVIAALAALRMLRPARTAPDPGARVNPGKAGAAGAGLGTVTGFLGVGGGFLAVPALVGVLKLPMRRAVGTSLLVITINSLAALGARAGTGMHLDWAVIAPFTAAAMLGAWDGKRLSRKLKGGTLQRVFAYVLLAVAVSMLADVLA
ncbi:sulfite exporter TauE/SafE family protein [Streptomyces sp. NPDC014983]|uniref:sulfite exporter TauE/SafE family protein n=1 Tax=Streptomyces sp. NPDC014983 TaxID=3364933 RepID=UPI0036FACF5F